MSLNNPTLVIGKLTKHQKLALIFENVEDFEPSNRKFCHLNNNRNDRYNKLLNKALINIKSKIRIQKERNYKYYHKRCKNYNPNHTGDVEYSMTFNFVPVEFEELNRDIPIYDLSIPDASLDIFSDSYFNAPPIAEVLPEDSDQLPESDLREAEGEINREATTASGRVEGSDGSSIMGMMEDGAKDVLNVTSGGEPAADLREAEGEINRRSSTPSGTDVGPLVEVTSGGGSKEYQYVSINDFVHPLYSHPPVSQSIVLSNVDNFHLNGIGDVLLDIVPSFKSAKTLLNSVSTSSNDLTLSINDVVETRNASREDKDGGRRDVKEFENDTTSPSLQFINSFNEHNLLMVPTYSINDSKVESTCMTYNQSPTKLTPPPSTGNPSTTIVNEQAVDVNYIGECTPKRTLATNTLDEGEDDCQICTKLSSSPENQSIDRLIKELTLKVKNDINSVINNAIGNNWVVIDPSDDPLCKTDNTVVIDSDEDVVSSIYATPTSKCKDYDYEFKSFDDDFIPQVELDSYNGFYLIDFDKDWRD